MQTRNCIIAIHWPRFCERSEQIFWAWWWSISMDNDFMINGFYCCCCCVVIPGSWLCLFSRTQFRQLVDQPQCLPRQVQETTMVDLVLGGMVRIAHVFCQIQSRSLSHWEMPTSLLPWPGMKSSGLTSGLFETCTGPRFLKPHCVFCCWNSLLQSRSSLHLSLAAHQGGRWWLEIRGHPN